MKAERWAQVEELLAAALECEPGKRAALLDAAGDEELRKEVASLLAVSEQARAFIEAPAIAFAADVLTPTSAKEIVAGRRIGPYRILREVGHGGMGAVYLAARADEHYKKQVAIKLVHRGFDNAFIVKRFLSERQILANLDHPNIAKLIDGGATEDGIPYLVMDYVEGLPIDQYCDRQKLTTVERLRLFRAVCAAVQYAHRNLIVHRDIKPSNILVTEDGTPKLLDFGIAKLLSPGAAQSHERTATVARIMTPQYASPEQVRGTGLTTASDTYSLGVLLYKLLTGHYPYRFKTLVPTEIEKIICEKEPLRPSTAITRVEESTDERGATTGRITPKQVSEARGEQPGRLRRKLEGDLDGIVLMAMRKEPERRYSSVEQFSEDIRRHLDGLPIIARSDTFNYRAKKFVKRHRLGVGATLVIVLALVGGIVATARQARVARQERDKAQHINAFLQDMLSAAAPEIKGTDIKVIDVLNDASHRAKTELADKPEVMADVLLTVGRTYISLGRYDLAEADLRAGLDASLKANGEMHSTTATTMGWLGLALANRNKAAEGEQISRKAIELQRKLHPWGHEDLGVALYSLGANLIGKGEPKAAVPFLQEAEAMIKKYLGENHGYHLAALGMLGRAHEQSGDPDGAESLYRQAIDVGRGVEYRYRIFLAQASAYLGELLINKGNYSEAESRLRESESIYREQLGDTNYSIGLIKQDLGRVHFLKGDHAKAENEYREALDLLRKISPEESPWVVSATAGLGLALTRAGKPAEGEPFLRKALEIRKKLLPQGDVQISITESALGECLTAQKRYREAEPLLTSGYDRMKSKLSEEDGRTVEARQRVVKLYQAWGKPNDAARYR